MPDRFPLKPNSTIGILGGGQLGRMLALSAARMGYRTIVLEPQIDCPAAQVSNRQIIAPYDDEPALAELASVCDVITYEFENVPIDAAHYLEKRIELSPTSLALEKAQDRLLEKEFLESAGASVAPFIPVGQAQELVDALEEFSGGVLKTRRFGYDGKGQKVYTSPVGLAEAQSDLDSIGQGPYVLEKLIEFDAEFSLIATRNRAGQVRCFDPAINRHEDGILRRSLTPGMLSNKCRAQVEDTADKVLKALDYVGTIGVEFFQIGEDILVNEYAPRVHNSGHWTVEACSVSQFDQHIRAIAGLGLGDSRRHHDCEMINLIGDEIEDVTKYFNEPASFVTLYGKSEVRAGRKMGHVTRLTNPV